MLPFIKLMANIHLWKIWEFKGCAKARFGAHDPGFASLWSRSIYQHDTDINTSCQRKHTYWYHSCKLFKKSKHCCYSIWIQTCGESMKHEQEEQIPPFRTGSERSFSDWTNESNISLLERSFGLQMCTLRADYWL